VTNAPAKRYFRWPIAIVAMIALHATAMVVVIVHASRDPSFAVEPNSYQKALAWDAFSARRHASDLLGWSARAHTERMLDAGRTREIDCDIVDRAGHPVSGATVALLAFPHARGDQRTRISLRETEPGKYSAHAPMVRDGLWELRLVAQRGADVFTTTMLHTVEGPP
jgi:nitrogen fixation protein FixH